MGSPTRSFAMLLTALGLSGCTSFSQVYHFQSSASNGPTNFFRVKVNGDAQTAKARYLAGFYDERAVDLYFNELKSPQGEEAQLRKLFVDGQKAPGEDAVIKPLTPDKAHGTFVMIFSTNPKAIADTIGAFAQSQIVADAVTNLVNKREVEMSRLLTATKGSSDEAATSVADELKVVLPAQGDTPPASAILLRSYLRALELIARETGGPPALADFGAARAWLGRSK